MGVEGCGVGWGGVCVCVGVLNQSCVKGVEACKIKFVQKELRYAKYSLCKKS